MGRGRPRPTAGVARGAYILRESDSDHRVTLIATGSEVSVALAAREILEGQGIGTRVVSAPCLEWFAQEPLSYRESVLAPHTLRVSIEAGVAQGWREWIGDNGIAISLEHYGASASAATLFDEYGFTGEKVAAKIMAALA